MSLLYSNSERADLASTLYSRATEGQAALENLRQDWGKELFDLVAG